MGKQLRDSGTNASRWSSEGTSLSLAWRNVDRLFHCLSADRHNRSKVLRGVDWRNVGKNACYWILHERCYALYVQNEQRDGSPCAKSPADFNRYHPLLLYVDGLDDIGALLFSNGESIARASVVVYWVINFPRDRGNPRTSPTLVARVVSGAFSLRRSNGCDNHWMFFDSYMAVIHNDTLKNINPHADKGICFAGFFVYKRIAGVVGHELLKSFISQGS
ncbi:MAG: hypothetical protein PHV93_03335 [Candidatus Pacebacteria bacterium]|nr:hypothetical protein [Candidatus Paceibacterota bacterium]